MELEQPKRPYHHGDLRNALLVAGQQLLQEEGVAALDLRKVARRAGVSHAAPYRHFADKQALLAALAEEGFRLLTASILAARDSAANEPRTQLLAMARAYVHVAINAPDLTRIMFGGAIGDRAAFPTLYATSKESFIALSSVIEQGQHSGVIVPGDPIRLTLVTWSLMHGYAMLLVEGQIPGASGDPATLEADIERCIETLYSGLALH
ncbi:MAG: TetR/AcrR family transcriptional regulator [Roseiflexaceae bacterium]|nr:TetR/AcrR family transcriptional regulator [Roseiflexaceae bacterium]